MKPSLVRPIEFASHPIVLQTYILATPSIDEVYQEVKTCIRHRTPGAMLIGTSRFGKTYAVRYMASIMKEEFPKIVVVTFGCKKKKAPVESAFFENILEAIGHENPHAGTNSAKRTRLTNMLTGMVNRSGQNLLIVFADEAQRLEVIEYEWLRDVHDDLERRGIRMVTFLVGQQKLVNQKNAFKTQGEMQIVARFMIDEMPFHGVRTAQDIATCLAGYDMGVYPAASDWTYTRFFLPHAYNEGLRLVDHADELWDSFNQAHAAAGFQFKLEIPMQYFSRAVEIALTDCSDHDNPNFKLTPVIWDSAVQASKFVVAIEEMRLDPGLDD